MTLFDFLVIFVSIRYLCSQEIDSRRSKFAFCSKVNCWWLLKECIWNFFVPWVMPKHLMNCVISIVHWAMLTFSLLPCSMRISSVLAVWIGRITRVLLEDVCLVRLYRIKNYFIAAGLLSVFHFSLPQRHIIRWTWCTQFNSVFAIVEDVPKAIWRGASIVFLEIRVLPWNLLSVPSNLVCHAFYLLPCLRTWLTLRFVAFVVALGCLFPRIIELLFQSWCREEFFTGAIQPFPFFGAWEAGLENIYLEYHLGWPFLYGHLLGLRDKVPLWGEQSCVWISGNKVLGQRC